LQEKLHSLSSEVTNLSGGSNSQSIANLTTSLNSLSTSLTSEQSQLSSARKKLTTVCSSVAVSNEYSNLNGEQTAGGGISESQYYSDLDGILSAVCGSAAVYGGGG
jgi:hypothetical protein